MSETYSCTFADCGKVFLKAYELKKHKATHEDPERVFYCPECDFITLQKKNLAIHFAIHTGEKTHQCPEVISLDGFPESPIRGERCEYRTNDPAALTKHRKKVHGYIPPPNRSRPAKAAPRKPHQKKDGKASRRPRPSRYPIPVSCRKPSRIPLQAHSPTSGAGYVSTSTSSSKDSSPFFWQGNMQSVDSDTSEVSGCDSSPLPWKGDAYGQSMVPNASDVSGHDSSPFLWQADVDAYGRSVDPGPSVMTGCDPSIFSSAAFMSPYEKMEWDTFYDASLHPQWMAQYEEGYTTFDVTGLKYLPEPLQAVPPPAPPCLDMPTGQMGCLCPEWMVETGIEGWGQPVLGTHKEFYVFDA